MKATRIQYQEFISSFAWQEIRAILKERLENIRDSLEAAGSHDVWQDMKETNINRGRAEEIRYLINLPGFISENYESMEDFDKVMKEGGEENA